MNNLETAIDKLDADNIYLALPAMIYCNKQLLPLFIINKTAEPIIFLSRRTVAVISDEDHAAFAGGRTLPSAAAKGELQVIIESDSLGVVDDYDIYVDGDLLEWWEGTIIVGGEPQTYWCYARKLNDDRQAIPHVVKLELKHKKLVDENFNQ
jgi:hypothetical protein